MSKKPSPEEFGKIVFITGGSRCRTCSKKEWIDVIHRVLEVWASKEGGSPSIVRLAEYLTEHYEFQHSEHALRNHILNHEKDLWAKVKKRHNL